MKVKVIRPFNDKDTGETRYPKETAEYPAERAKELISRGFVKEVKSKTK